MAYIATKAEAEEFLTDRYSFNAGTLTAFWEGEDLSSMAYVVRSYGTPIAKRTQGGEIWLTPIKYSTTTSRHLNLVKKAWGVN